MDTNTHIAGRNRSGGFTLIEVMLATGIVGTLSAVALPVYQDYIARAEVVEVVTGLSAAKTSIVESVATTGAVPETLTAPFSADSVTSVTLYRYSNCPAQGGIEVQLAGSGISAALQNKTVRLQYNDAGRWTCSQGATNAVSESLLPRACRNAAEAIPADCGSIEYSTLSMNVAGTSAGNSFGDADWSSGYGGGSDGVSEDYSSTDDEGEFSSETMEWEQPAGSDFASSGSSGSSSSSTSSGSSSGGDYSGGATSTPDDTAGCEDQFEGANETGSNDAMLTAEGDEACMS